MKEWFSHDFNARNDKKVTSLNMKHGMAGIGVFWCIVEMLFEESGYLNIDEYDRIAFALRVKSDLVKSVVEDFGLFKNDEERFWSESALDRLNIRLEKSDKARQSALKRWNRSKRNANVMRSHSDGNASKVKESKGKESKEEEGDLNFDEFWNAYHDKTGKPKTDKEAAIKKWSKLSKADREKAIEKIQLYADSIENKKYCKKARTYLEDRNFEDELIKLPTTSIEASIKFYEDEKSKTTDKNYHHLVAFVLGNNPTKKPLETVLSLSGQISYQNFISLMGLCKKKDVKLLHIILDLENYTKGSYKNVYLTLNKWIRER